MGMIKLRRRAHETPETVFDNWPTDRATRVSVVEVVAWRIDVAQNRGTGSLDKRIGLKLRVAVVDFPGKILSRAESVRLKLHPKVAVKIIAAALGDDVDHAACCAAKFSIETAGLYLHFLYELERQVIVFAQLASAGVCDFRTIRDECVLCATRAVYLKATAQRFFPGCA